MTQNRSKNPEELYSVRPLKEDELRELWAFNEIVYGEDNIVFEKLHEWWSTYPHGSLCIFKNDLLQNRMIDNHIGGIGIYPISKDFYFDLMHKRAEEEDMSRAIIQTGIKEHENPLTPDYWYISGISMRESYRHSLALPYLIDCAKKARYGLYYRTTGSHHHHIHTESVPENRIIQVCAIATSNEGNRLLKRLKFKVSPENPAFYEMQDRL
jgi:hypothetical protein